MKRTVIELACAAFAVAYLGVACSEGPTIQVSDDGSGEPSTVARAAGQDDSALLSPSCDPAEGELPDLKLQPIASVKEPVQIVSPPNDPRLFVVSRHGAVLIVDDGKVRKEPFLEVAVDHHYVEVGLLGLAFHPAYEQNGLFYLQYIEARAHEDMASGDLIVAEYQRDPESPNRGRSKPRRELLRLPQPTQKHKAGTLAFDSLGLLYIAIGNGGDPTYSGDPANLQGKVLRVDPAPDQPSYLIPTINPRRRGWAPEVLETGLRNPWRIALDPCTDDLYIADVGNNVYEEINVSPGFSRGHDFGFPVFEGEREQCEVYEVECLTERKIPPVAGYSHGAGCSIIGGVVYRGHRIPALRGMYLYSDNCSGLFGGIVYEDGAVERSADLSDNINPDGIKGITSFGTDWRGEVYVASRKTGEVYRIEPE